MATYVLVHGAWHGGWCWEQVASVLRDEKHQVFTPTLRGLIEPLAEGGPRIGLGEHIADVSRSVIDANAGEVVLVGHSYAGMVVTSVAAMHADIVSHLVVIDGFLPERDETAIDLLPDSAGAHYRDSAFEQGGNYWIPPRPLENLGVRDSEVIARVAPRLLPHPLQTYLDRSPHGASEVSSQGTYLLCADWATPFRALAARAHSLGWTVDELPADHEVVLTEPDLLAKRLLAIGTRPEQALADGRRA